MYKRVPLVVRYTACGGLFNQHYSHVAALSLALALGGDVVLPPGVKRDSFAHYFSQDPSKNEVGVPTLEAKTRGNQPLALRRPSCACVACWGSACNSCMWPLQPPPPQTPAAPLPPSRAAPAQVSWTPVPFDTLWDGEAVHEWLKGGAGCLVNPSVNPVWTGP